MTVRIRMHPDGAITVHQRVWWPLRLFVDDVDIEVEWDGCFWRNADTGQPVGRAIYRALEREVPL